MQVPALSEEFGAKTSKSVPQANESVSGVFWRRMIAVGAAAAVSAGGSRNVVGPTISVGDRHRMTVAADVDRDVLADHEEQAICYQPFRADQNRNSFPDGIELAAHCADAISRLPAVADANDPGRTYRNEVLLLGMESCGMCGESINVGTIQVVNRSLGLRTELPIVAVHGVDRMGVAALDRIIRRPTGCGNLGTLNLPGDLNGDCRVDSRDLAEMASRWIDPTDSAMEPPVPRTGRNCQNNRQIAKNPLSLPGSTL